MATLKRFLDALAGQLPRCESYSVVIRPGISDHEEDRPEADADPVGLIHCDHGGKEILLIPVQGGPKRGRKVAPMGLGQLVEQLKSFGQDCGTYSLEATPSKPKPSDLIRCDFPIASLEINDDTKVCALIWR